MHRMTLKGTEQLFKCDKCDKMQTLKLSTKHIDLTVGCSVISLCLANGLGSKEKT